MHHRIRRKGEREVHKDEHKAREHRGVKWTVGGHLIQRSLGVTVIHIYTRYRARIPSRW